MTDETSTLVRCAGCGHNFETDDFGEIDCPTCGSKVWVEPPEGSVVRKVDTPPSGDPPETDRPVPEPGRFDPAVEFPGVPEIRHTPVLSPAWEQGTGGVLGRFFLTAKQVLSQPGRFFTAGFGERFWPPVSYAWIIATLATLGFAVYSLLELESNYESILAQLREQLEASGSQLDPERLLDNRRSVYTVSAYLSPLLGLLNLLMTAALFHVGVMLTAGKNQGFKATLRATAYGSTPMLLVVVPWVGQLIGGIWSLVIQVIGLAQTHQISPGRASLAVLLPITAVLLLLGGALV